MRKSGEHYLQAIYSLQQEGGAVRSVDVARALSFSKPSVSRAMKLLVREGYIKVASDGAITLTGEGEKRGRIIAERKNILTEFFMMTADIDEALAGDHAERMGYLMDDEVFQGIRGFVEEVNRQ